MSARIGDLPDKKFRRNFHTFPNMWRFGCGLGWFVGMAQSHVGPIIHIQDRQLSGGPNPTADYGDQVPAQAALEVMQPKKIPGITEHLANVWPF